MRRALLVSLIVAVAACSAGIAAAPHARRGLGAFYVDADRATEIERRARGLTWRKQNGLLPGYGAISAFDRARRLGIGGGTALLATEKLGYFNEVLEHVLFRAELLDSTPEIYKDLRINRVGALAARWLHDELGRSSHEDRRRLAGWLAANGVLAGLPDDPRIPPLPEAHDLALALRAYARDRDAITAATLSALTRRRGEIARDLDGVP